MVNLDFKNILQYFILYIPRFFNYENRDRKKKQLFRFLEHFTWGGIE